MLHIENIDDNSIRFGNAIGGGTYPSVYPKTLLAKTDTQDPERVWITDRESKAGLLSGRDVSTINLNGTVYLTAMLFVIAFNNLVSAGGAAAIVGASGSYNTPDIRGVANASVIIPADTIHSLSVTCTLGTVTVTVGSNSTVLELGQSMGWTAGGLIDTAITIDATGAPNAADYNTIGPVPTTTTTIAATTTTTVPVTTTTTT